MNSDLIPIAAAVRVADWREAERLVRVRLQADATREDLLTMLAVSLQMQGRATDAIEAYERLTQLFPGRSEHWGNYATALREAGRLDAAATIYERVLHDAPTDAGQLVNYALLKLQQRDYAGARDVALRAYALEPDSPRVRIHAARACQACREYEDAEDLLKPWRQWLPLEDDGLQQELGDLQLALGDGDSAQVLLEDLVRRVPGNIHAIVHLASAYERLNRLPEAESLLSRLAGRLDGASGEVRMELAHVLAKVAQRKGDLAEAQAILEDAGLRGEGDYAHYYLLAEVRAKRNDVAGTMQALQSAHALHVEDLKHVIPKRFEPGASPLPLADVRVDADAYRRWPALTAPEAQHSPVFIVGFPRSGTTLLEQMLDAHPRLQSMDENPFFNKLSDQLAEQDIFVPQDMARLGQRDCDELRKRYLGMVCDTIPRRWDTQIVDKNPLNMLWLPLIHRLFPRAKFILALRHPCDVILSCYMQNFRSSVLAAACSDLQRLATSYVASMQSWLHHAALFGPDVLAVRNEDIVADVEGQAARIAQFLDLGDAAPLLGFHEHARRKGFIGTPSYTQVIQPVNSRGMNRWLRYREYIEPVLPILEPMLRHWGYSTDDAADTVASR
ncbi:tetratricopeptide (TPR) repeat protein [Dokdonella fugitiva]|uniref:Tetratricopeptide (TPR) repeat protein n=1 Tax=Dokdonella fugitiva TaxID=328517 RepID=A0A839F8N7_9GAMM|nr:tetratricopeptide repeat-containing sulfotransferase family protein [Dokdonella fugitiva]MBA8888511.1 tetratricopeptide (TPR) repeat protein [Dokdonella fugitiva]